MKSKVQKKEITPMDLGTRYKCYKCGTKFYDLGRSEPLMDLLHLKLWIWNHQDDKSSDILPRPLVKRSNLRDIS